jgi:hypothetical protein
MEELATSIIRVEEEALWEKNGTDIEKRGHWYPSTKLHCVTSQKTVHVNV